MDFVKMKINIKWLLLIIISTIIISLIIYKFYNSNAIGSIREWDVLQMCEWTIESKLEKNGYILLDTYQEKKILIIPCLNNDNVYIMLDSKYKPYIKILKDCDFTIDKNVIDRINKLKNVNLSVIEFLNKKYQSKNPIKY